jgi:hypothetical protein
MALIGVITREPNPPGVDLDHWRRLVANHPRLRRPPPREILNPFTGKPAVHVPPDTDATIYLDTSPVGAISVSDSSDGELVVWGPEVGFDDVETIASAIAAELGGRYTSFA